MAGLLTQSYQGSPDGMNLALPPDEIPETECRYVQDALLDFPGRLRRRGPVKNAAGSPTLTRLAFGIVGTIDPQGTDRYAILNGTSSAFLSLLTSSRNAISADIAWGQALSIAPYPVFHTAPALGGGALIGVSSDYKMGSTQSLAYWMGANKPNYSTGTATVVRGATAVTGSGTSWSTNVVPGMFMIGPDNGGDTTNGIFGVVQTVNSNTSITLAGPSNFDATAKSLTFQSLRGIVPKVMKGTITCDTSRTTVTGGDTKFRAQGLASGTWHIYRASDNALVGTVASVQSEFSLTLNVVAQVSCADDPYIAMNVTAPTTWALNSGSPGFITAVYAARQWYANNGGRTHIETSRVWFSDPTDPEGLDMSDTGDWFDVFAAGSMIQPICALVPTSRALLVLKDREAWAIFGSTPDTFSAQLIDSDGTVSGMSAQNYAGGAIWAGREGILFFDGTKVQNLTAQKLGKYYRDIITTFDQTSKRMWSMIARDHYFLFVESCTPSVGVTKGAATTTPNRLTICINLLTGAISLMTNLDIHGATQIQGSLAPTTWYIVNDASIGHVCAVDDLFDSTGNDTITCSGNTLGPDFYWQGKCHDAGDGDRIKRWRWWDPNAEVQGDVLKVDAVLGLSLATHALSDTVPNGSGIFAVTRTDINWDSQHLALRLYQNSTSVTDVQIGPYQIAFKYLRTGRPG